MRAKLVSKNDFNPITISITLESEKEVVELWLRLNARMHAIIGDNDATGATTKQKLAKYTNQFNDNCVFDDVWKILDNELRQ